MRALLLFGLALFGGTAGGSQGPQGAPGAAPVEQPAQPRPARWPRGLTLEVQSGQVLALVAEQRLYRSPASGALTIQSEVRFEIGARARARLLLAGGFQMDLAGPAILEIAAPEGVDGSLDLRLLEHGLVDFECRQPGAALSLPGGQVLHPRRGVLRLERSAGLRSRLEVRGGLSVELDLGGRYSFELPVGFARTVPERLSPLPATYRGTTPAR